MATPLPPSTSNIELTGSPKLGALAEWVQLRNIGSEPIELLGAKLRVPNAIPPVENAGKNVFTFTASTVLAPGASIRIAGYATAPALSFDTPNKLPLFYEQGKDVVELLAADDSALKAVNIDNLPPAPWVTSTVLSAGVGIHDFGKVQQGAGAKQITFTIENGTGEDMVLSGTPAVAVSAGSPDFQVISQPKSPVPGGKTVEFVVAFDPSAAGSRLGTLSIAVAKLAQPLLVSLSGEGIAAAKPVLGVSHGGAALNSGASVDLGSAQVGGAAITTSLTLENLGTAPLQLSALTLANAAAFTLAKLPALPAVLAPGASISVDVGFNPAQVGAQQTNLTIASNAGADFVIDLRATCQDASPKLQLLLDNHAVAANGDYDLGTVDLGAALAASLTVKNLGAGKLDYALSSQITQGPLTGPNSAGESLAPAGSRAYPIQAQTYAEGPRAATITVTSNDPSATKLSFRVHGSVRAPSPKAVLSWCWSPAPEQPFTDGNTYDFGALNRSQVDPNMMANADMPCWMLRVRNHGTGELKVNIDIVEGFPIFKNVEMGLYHSEIIMPPGYGNSAFESGVIFRVPLDARLGEYTAKVVITSNDPSIGKLTAYMKGRWIG